MTSPITQPLMTAIETLEMSKAHINETMAARLQALLPDKGDVKEPEIERFEISDLDEMKALVKSIQKQVVTDSGEILSNASIRDLASLTGCITSLIRLFKAEQATIDTAKAVNEIHNAVIAAIGCLTPEQQAPFFIEISKTKWGMV
ncbi:MAG: hypothetical protein DRH08_02295 [Deltaproteobacteria bacterium]|nr:MAG: hypothetical protein DRH08_02295 [Deltaproteobacteria bacterium]